MRRGNSLSMSHQHQTHFASAASTDSDQQNHNSIHERVNHRESRADLSLFESSNHSYTEVFAWGSDAQGQIGLGHNPKKDSFYPIPRFCSFNIVIKTLSCGRAHSAFVSEQGEVYSMGSNKYGKLGIPLNEEHAYSPQLVQSLSHHEIERVSCGADHSAAVSKNGDVLTWGRNDSGQLGTGDLIDRCKAEHVNLPMCAINVSCGGSHTMVLLGSGQVCGFGSNEFGQIGSGGIRAKVRAFEMVRWTEGSLQRRSNSSLEEECVQVCCGLSHTLFVLHGGRVFGCGDNRHMQLGMSSTVEVCDLPAMIPRMQDIVSVAASATNSAAISSNGQLFLIGNLENQSDISSKSIEKINLSPLLMDELKLPVRSVSLGDGFGCAIDVQGSLYTWGGKNHVGQLALGHNGFISNPLSPDRIIALNGKHAVSIACGENFVIALGREVRGVPSVIEVNNNNSVNYSAVSGSQMQQYLTKQLRSDSPFLEECSLNTNHRNHTTYAKRATLKLATTSEANVPSFVTPMHHNHHTRGFSTVGSGIVGFGGSRSVKDILRIGREDFDEGTTGVSAAAAAAATGGEDTQGFEQMMMMTTMTTQQDQLDSSQNQQNLHHFKSSQERIMTQPAAAAAGTNQSNEIPFQQMREYNLPSSNKNRSIGVIPQSSHGHNSTMGIAAATNARGERIVRSASAAFNSRENPIKLDRLCDYEDERGEFNNTNHSNLLGVLGLNRNIEVGSNSSTKHLQLSNSHLGGGTSTVAAAGSASASGGYQNRMPHSSSSQLSSTEKVRFLSRLSGKENQLPKGVKDVTNFYATDSMFVDYSKDQKSATMGSSNGFNVKQNIRDEFVEEEIKRAVRVEVNRLKLELAAERDKNIANVRVKLQVEHRDEVERVRKELVSRSEQHRLVESQLRQELEQVRHSEEQVQKVNAKLEAELVDKDSKITLLEESLRDVTNQAHTSEINHARIASKYQEEINTMEIKIQQLEGLILKKQLIVSSSQTSKKQHNNQNQNQSSKDQFAQPVIHVKTIPRKDNYANTNDIYTSNYQNNNNRRNNQNRLTFNDTTPLVSSAVLVDSESEWQANKLKSRQQQQQQYQKQSGGTYQRSSKNQGGTSKVSEKRSNSLQYWREDNCSMSRSSSQVSLSPSTNEQNNNNNVGFVGSDNSMTMEEEVLSSYQATRARDFDLKWRRISQDEKILLNNNSSGLNEKVIHQHHQQHRGSNSGDYRQKYQNSAESFSRANSMSAAMSTGQTIVKPNAFLENQHGMQSVTPYQSDLEEVVHQRSLNSEYLNQSVQSLNKRIVEFERVLTKSKNNQHNNNN